MDLSKSTEINLDWHDPEQEVKEQEVLGSLEEFYADLSKSTEINLD